MKKNEYEKRIELGQLMAIIHHSTERLAIYVVADREGGEDGVPDFYLTEDAFVDCCYGGSDEEENRLMKYYSKTPVWNITTSFETIHSSVKGNPIVPVIRGHCYWKDVRESYYREKADIKKQKQREYRRKRKEQAK